MTRGSAPLTSRPAASPCLARTSGSRPARPAHRGAPGEPAGRLLARMPRSSLARSPRSAVAERDGGGGSGFLTPPCYPPPPPRPWRPRNPRSNPGKRGATAGLAAGGRTRGTQAGRNLGPRGLSTATTAYALGHAGCGQPGAAALASPGVPLKITPCPPLRARTNLCFQS